MAVGAVGCGKIGRLNLVNYATADVDSTMPPSCYITINDKNIVDTHRLKMNTVSFYCLHHAVKVASAHVAEFEKSYALRCIENRPMAYSMRLLSTDQLLHPMTFQSWSHNIRSLASVSEKRKGICLPGYT